MRTSELRQKSRIELIKICRDNKAKYCGYSKHQRKEDIIKFILKRNHYIISSDIKIPPPVDLDMGFELYTMFETEDEKEEDNDSHEEHFVDVYFEGIQYLEDTNSWKPEIFSIDKQLIGIWNVDCSNIIWNDENTKLIHDNMRREMILAERPEGKQIDELIVSLQDKYPSSNVIYDTHNDTEDNIIYKANKEKYINHFNSLGEHGEKILYHGTDGCNLMGILRDDFRLTSIPTHGSLFGKGIYFTNDIEKAIYYSERNKGQTKYIIVAIVHIGDIVLGSSTMDIHPLMPCGLKHYDTSVDNIQNPKQFVKKKNGTYNILGIITIENYIESSHNKFTGSFRVRNTTGDSITLSWVLPAHINELPFVNPSHLKRMSIIKGKYSNKDISCQIGHTFICTNRYGIIRIFKIKFKKEMITI